MRQGVLARRGLGCNALTVMAMRNGGRGDVENALVGVIAAALYPNGTAAACAAGVPCSVFRGWPMQQAETATIAGNFVNVSVASRNGVERNKSNHRYRAYWQIGPAHTLPVAVSNNANNPFGTRLSPMCSVRSVTDVSGPYT
jgi:hypothetical protein